MAQKRMFSLSVTDTDRFTDMPASAQALYFHLSMHGDDDGFVSSPRKIQRAVGANDGDLRLLAAKGFIIPFDSGIICITDWKLNNTIKKDRYQATIYQAEIALLSSDPSGRYCVGSTLVPERFQNGSKMEPQYSIGKDSKEEDREADKPPAPARFVKPTVEEVAQYCEENGCAVDAEQFVSYYDSNGWRVGRNPMKSWRAAVRNWARRDQQKAPQPPGDLELVTEGGIRKWKMKS